MTCYEDVCKFLQGEVSSIRFIPCRAVGSESEVGEKPASHRYSPVSMSQLQTLCVFMLGRYSYVTTFSDIVPPCMSV